MNYFLKSRLRHFILALFLIAVFIFAACLFISESLRENKSTIVNYFKDITGCQVMVEDITFDIFQGLRLKGLTVYYADTKKAPVVIEEAALIFKPFSGILGRAELDKIKIEEAHLFIKKEKEGINLQVIYSDIYNRISRNKRLISNKAFEKLDVYIKKAELVYLDNSDKESENPRVILDNAHFNFDSDKFRFNSRIRFTYRIPEKLFISRFFKSRALQQNINCSAQGKMQGKNLNIDMIVLDIGKDQVIGMGINKDFYSRNPWLDIAFIPSAISLNNNEFLRRNFDADGSIFVFLKINGLMDNPEIFLNGLFSECSFRYRISSGEKFEIRNLNAEAEYRNSAVNINNGQCWFNDLPLDFNLKVKTGLKPHIDFRLSFPKSFLAQQDTSLDKLEANFSGKIDKTMKGRLEVKALYVGNNIKLDMEGHFNDVDFDYYNPKEKYFKAASLKLLKNNTYKIQELNFRNIDSRVITRKNKFEVKGITGYGYGGMLEGLLDIVTKDKVLINATFKGHRLDVKSLMQDVNTSNKLLAGKMETRIGLDNRRKEFFNAYCYITKGIADLDILGGIVRLPPLKNKDFEVMHLYLAASKEIIRVRRIELFSADMLFNGHWQTNAKLEGLLKLKLSSALLNQSRQFKKLLNMTGIKKPFIEFRFLLGGTPKALRLLWLKDEFRDKIKQELPGWVKESIENNLDKAIDDLSRMQ